MQLEERAAQSVLDGAQVVACTCIGAGTVKRVVCVAGRGGETRGEGGGGYVWTVQEGGIVTVVSNQCKSAPPHHLGACGSDREGFLAQSLALARAAM